MDETGCAVLGSAANSRTGRPVENTPERSLFAPPFAEAFKMETHLFFASQHDNPHHEEVRRGYGMLLSAVVAVCQVLRRQVCWASVGATECIYIYIFFGFSEVAGNCNL